MVPHFSGMFVALTATTALWSQQQWDTDCASMAEVGMTFMVVPHTGRMIAPPSAECPQGKFETYYPVTPANFNGTGSLCFEQIGDLKSTGGTIGNIFRAAAKANLTGIHLGLMFAPAEHGFPSQQRNGTYANWGDFQAQVAVHLNILFSAAEPIVPIAGFYAEIEFSNDAAWITDMPAFGKDYLGGIARTVSALPRPNYVWASPYSIGNLTRYPTGFDSPQTYADAMRSAFNAAGPGLHHVAMQDSMGAQGNSFQNASDFLGNMSSRVAAWANVEIFESWPRDCQWSRSSPCPGRHPAPWSRIEKQMANEAAVLGGAAEATLIAWEWYSCFSPNAGGDPGHKWPAEAKANYVAYAKYLHSK